MNISDRAQEVLEKYWIHNKEEHKPWKMEIVFGDAVVEEMIAGVYGKKEGHHLELTEKGWLAAQGCVRRHRLAERLLVDVLAVKKETVHDIGCEFEHVLRKDVEENICTLLGHPRTCPHGKPIPEGDCCKDDSRKLRKMVLPLSECEEKEKAKIAYIMTDKEKIINKLTAIGVLPGLTIQLLKKTPTFLFKIGESQFAIDRSLAEKIHVRLLS